MAPHNDPYRTLTVETMQWMFEEIRKNHDDILVIKTKFGLISGLIGFTTGIIGAVGSAAVIHLMHL